MSNVLSKTLNKNCLCLKTEVLHSDNINYLRIIYSCVIIYTIFVII